MKVRCSRGSAWCTFRGNLPFLAHLVNHVLCTQRPFMWRLIHR